MTLLPSYRLCSHAVVLLAVLGAGMAQGSIWLLLFAGTLAAGSRLVSEGPRAWAIGRRWSLLLTAIALIAAGLYVLVEPGTDRVVQGVLVFSVWITVIKLYERHTVENEVERLILSALLMSLAAVHGSDLLFGVVLMGWIVLGLIVLVLIPFHVGSDEFERGGVQNRSIRTDIVAGPKLRNHLQAGVLVVVLATLIVSACLFFVLPRSGDTILAPIRRDDIRVTGSGVRADVTLPQELQILNQGAAVADIVQLAGDPLATGPLYLRTATSSRYVGNGQWVPWRHRPSKMNWCPADRWVTLPPSGRTSHATLQVHLLQGLVYLPVLRGTTELRTDRDVWISWDRISQTIGIEAGGQPTNYELKSDLLSPARIYPVDPRAWSDAIVALAKRVLTQAGLAETAPEDQDAASKWRHQAVVAFRRYLEEGNFRYTLDLRTVGSTSETREMDPVERFLLVERRGHCEYFAAGFVSLCQASGIQSRIVTGFLADAAGPGHWQAFSDDAHAWAEARIEGDAWTRVDPSGSLAAQESMHGVLASLRQLYGSVDMFWQLNVVGFTRMTQQRVAESIWPRWHNALDTGVRWINELLAKLDVRFGLGRAGTIWLMSVGAILVLVIIVAVRLVRRRRRARRISGLQDSESVRTIDVLFYEELLRRMKAAGLTKPLAMTPMNWCSNLAETHAEVSRIASALVSRFYGVRYGHQPLTLASRHDIQEEMQELARALRSVAT